MAKTRHTTPTPTRRTLGAGLLATVVGSTITAGIAAGMAASVGDGGPVEPDAELIDLCARFDAIEREHYAEAVPFWRTGDDDGADAAMRRMNDRHDPLLERIVELPPTTFAGAVALARTLDQWTHGDFAREGYTDDMLAHTLIRGLVGRVGA